MHCKNPECNYAGEHFAAKGQEVKCPECKTGILEKNVIQHFNVAGSHKNSSNPPQKLITTITPIILGEYGIPALDITTYKVERKELSTSLN